MFFEHGGRAEARAAGAASFLYPFLDERETDLEAVLADVARSVLMKADEVGALREQTLTEGARHAATRRRTSCARGSTRAARCSRSATAARRPTRWTSSPTLRAAAAARALDLTEDPAIITALANDIGTDAIFSRQVIAYGGPGDALIALSTSGNSGSVIAALIEARRARAGDDRAASATAAGGSRRKGWPTTSIVTRSEHIPRIQEAQASAYHVLRRAGRGRVRRRPRAGRGDRPGGGLPPVRLPPRHRADLAGFVLNDERGVLLEVGGRRRRGRRLPAPAGRRGAAAGGDRGGARPASVAPAGERGFRILASPHGGEPAALVSPDTATCDDCLRRAVRPGRPPLPLPVRQLHQLRPALHDRARRPLRPAAAPRWPASRCARAARRVRRPRRPPLPRRSPTRARSAGRRCGCCRATTTATRRCARRSPRCARAGSSRSRASAATTSRAWPGDEPAVAALRARKQREDKPFAVMVRDVAAARAAGGADRRGGGAAGRPRPPDRARAAAEPDAPVGARRSPRAPPTSACCCPTRRCTTCCSPTSASRS